MVRAITLRCDDYCTMLVVDKDDFGDGEVCYNLSMQDSRYDHAYNTLWGRVKRACKILFGKPIYYSDICISNPDKFYVFVKELNGFANEAVERDDENAE